MTERVVIIRARDKNGNPLPGVEVFAYLGDLEIGHCSMAFGQGTIIIDGSRTPLRIVAKYQVGEETYEETETLAPDADECVLNFPVAGRYSTVGKSIVMVAAGLLAILLAIGIAIYLGQIGNVLPLAVGGLFVVASVALAFIFSTPNDLQKQLIRGMFALGLGGAASAIPGIINIKLDIPSKAAIAAGGAIAVYVITFFFKPAGDDPQ